MNALENVTIPRMEHVISYINRELDELERYARGRAPFALCNKNRVHLFGSSAFVRSVFALKASLYVELSTEEESDGLDITSISTAWIAYVHFGVPWLLGLFISMVLRLCCANDG